MKEEEDKISDKLIGCDDYRAWQRECYEKRKRQTNREVKWFWIGICLAVILVIISILIGW